MRQSLCSLCGVLALVVWTSGCSQQSSNGAAEGTLPTDAVASAGVSDVTLCGACGQIKGSEVCCKADAEKCDHCRLAKDSVGCCKMEAGTDVVVCAKCGESKGSENCCAEGKEACAECGLHKGSLGCCKIKT